MSNNKKLSPKQQLMLQILDEVRDYYGENQNRRSYNDDDNCRYSGPNNTHCAVAHFFNSRGKRRAKKYDFYMKTPSDIIEDRGMNKEYRDLGFSFWNDIQTFHDTHSYWNSRKDCFLTKEGVNYYNFVKRLIKSNAYDTLCL